MRNLPQLACSIALVLFTSSAAAGIGPEKSIAARPFPLTGALGSATAFDGTHYVVLYTDRGLLRVQRLDEDGTLAGDPSPFDDPQPASSADIASDHNGLSLAVWSSPTSDFRGTLRLAWIPSAGQPTASFTLAEDFQWSLTGTVAAVQDHFLVAWSDRYGVYVSRVEPGATSITSTFKVADSGGTPERIATAGSGVLLVWNTVAWAPSCIIPEGCPYAVSHLRFLTPAGEPLGEALDWPEETDEPLPASADDLFVVAPSTIVRRTGNELQRWSVANAASIARLGDQLYATSVRWFYDGRREQYFGPVGANRRIADEYRFIATTFDGAIAWPRLTAGSHSLLASYNGADAPYGGAHAITYRIIDLRTPFPRLPIAPATLSVLLGASSWPAQYHWSQATMEWPLGEPVERYFVEADPLSDPTARSFLGPVPGGMSQGFVDGLDMDVLYAFRVYASTADGLSKPAESILRTPPAAQPRAAIDFAASVDGGVATFRWKDVSSNETGFRITAFGVRRGWLIVAERPENATTATILLLAGRYSYYLQTVNAAGAVTTRVPLELSGPIRTRAVRR